MIEYRVLGPLQAVRDGLPVPLGGPRRRAVLARLLVDPGRVVPAEVLVGEVWGGSPPATAAKTVQKYVSELRRDLGDPAIETRGRGYRLAAAERRRVSGVAASAEEREIADRLARTAPPTVPGGSGAPTLSGIVGVDLAALDAAPVAG